MSTKATARRLADRFKEPSSYGGLAALLLLFGVNVDPGLLQNAVNVLAGLAGATSFFLGEPGSKG